MIRQRQLFGQERPVASSPKQPPESLDDSECCLIANRCSSAFAVSGRYDNLSARVR